MEREFNVQNLQVNETAISNNKKYSISKAIGIGLISIGLATAGLNAVFNTHKIPYTNIDKKNNVVASAEYNKILQETAPTYLNNTELHNILVLTGKSSLSEIETLTIQGPLSNNDLSELRYLKNLRSITIYNSNINISNLKYNQNLKEINIFNSTVTNTQDIPNTVTFFSITNSKVVDQQFTLPYNLETLNINNSLFYNMHLRCPENLVKFYLNTKSLLDMSILKNCSNLTDITIEKSPNILNGKVLTELDSLQTIKLDNYAPIWLTAKELSSLVKSDFDPNINLVSIARTFDNYVIQLMNDNKYLPMDRIIELASNFVLNKYSYNDTKYPILYSDDYQSPSSSAIHSHNATGIEYSTLFLALANRMNIPACIMYDDQYAEHNSNFYGYEPKEKKVWVGYNDGNGFKYLDLALEDREINVKIVCLEGGSKKIPDTEYNPINSPLVLPEDRIDKNIGFIVDENYVKNNTASGIEHKENVSNNYLRSGFASVVGAVVYLSVVLVEANKERNKFENCNIMCTIPYPIELLEDDIDKELDEENPHDYDEYSGHNKHIK